MTLAAFKQRCRENKEDWKYTDLDKMICSSFRRTPKSSASNGEQKCKEWLQHGTARLLFINGEFIAAQSDFGVAPSCILMGDHDSGYNITLGERTCLVAQPIELVFVTDQNAPEEINLKFSVDIGENGRLSLLENHEASNTVITMETTVNLQKHAKFVHGKIVRDGVHLAANNIEVADGAYYCDYCMFLGGEPTRNETRINLNNPQAQATVNGIMMLDGQTHADMTAKISHNAPQCSSRQICKAVLNGKSRGVFQGKISVAKDAQKSDGHQISRALLMSDMAEMDAKPELEIFADDVKCSHGSAIGCLDENAIFYLRSRGIEENMARELLIAAFLDEIIDSMPISEWKEIFRKALWGKE